MECPLADGGRGRDAARRDRRGRLHGPGDAGRTPQDINPQTAAARISTLMFCEMLQGVLKTGCSSTRMISIRNRDIGWSVIVSAVNLAVARAERIIGQQEQTKQQRVDEAVELRRMNRPAAGGRPG